MYLSEILFEFIQAYFFTYFPVNNILLRVLNNSKQSSYRINKRILPEAILTNQK